MITKTIYKYLEINPLVYLFGIISILIAAFKPFIIISILIVIHELGHFIVAKMLGVEVKSIYLYPLGGISKFFLPLNASYTKEILILISGPIAQILAKLLLTIIFPMERDMIHIYHYGILLFNLLPIYPLDGGKLMHIILSKFIPYEKSLKVTIIISYIIIIVYFFYNLRILNLNVIIITFFLMFKVYYEQNQIKYIYERFMLERYLYKYNFKETKIIDNPNKFYKNNKHIIKQDNRYYLEEEYLLKKYKK